MKKATILLAHGSSDANWLAPFTTLTEAIKQQLPADTPVALAYMELAQPSLQQSINDLRQQGYDRIEVLPLFFAAGRHLRKDVPLMLQQQQQQLCDQGLPCELVLHSPIGLEPEVAQAISQVVIRQLS